MRTISGLIFMIVHFYAIESTVDAYSSSQTVHDRIDSLVNLFRKELNVPGVSVGVVANGETLMAKGYGLRNRTDPQSNVTERTLFAIGSCTKAFTTFVLDTLVNVDGILSWDDLVISHIPEFRTSNADTTSRITVKDLVTHVSGLPRHDQAWVYGNFSRNEWLARLPYLQTNYDLRKIYQYNNIMYTIAGILIEKVTNRSWEDVVDDRILRPLNMTRTFSGGITEVLGKRVDDVSAPHRTSPDSKVVELIPWLCISPIGPAGAILSSADDMTKWIRRQLRLSGPSKEMHTAQAAIPSDPTTGASVGYGLGWGLAYHRKHYTVAHSGAVDGFLAFVVLFEKEKHGVVVLLNLDDDSVQSPIENLAVAIAEIVMNSSAATEFDNAEWVREAKLTKLRAEQSAENERKSNHASERSAIHEPEQLVGSYENGGYGEVKISLVDTRLFATYNNVLYTLHPQKTADYFKARSAFPSEFQFDCSFVRDYLGGDVNGFLFDLEPKEGVQPISFAKKIPEELFELKYLETFNGTFEEAITSEQINVRINEGKRFLVVNRGSQYAGKLKPLKRNWFRLERSPIDFVNSSGYRSSFEFVATNGTVSELKEYIAGLSTEVYTKQKE